MYLSRYSYWLQDMSLYLTIWTASCVLTPCYMTLSSISVETVVFRRLAWTLLLYRETKTSLFQMYTIFKLRRQSENKNRVIYCILELTPLLDSSNMSMSDWARISSIIETHYDTFDAFVVLHGTDTMAYTASALSFMLENLGKTVIITGSQVCGPEDIRKLAYITTCICTYYLCMLLALQ